MPDQHPHQPQTDAPLGFSERHIGPRADEVATMLDRLGFESLEALMDAAVPGAIRAAE